MKNGDKRTPKRQKVASATIDGNHIIEVPDGRITFDGRCKPLEDWMRKTKSLDFLNAIFGDCDGPANLCTLRNNSGGAGPLITSDDSEALVRFVNKHDVPGWGVYFCVSSMLTAKHHHSKESVREIPTLHTDIDLKDVDDTKKDIVRKLKALRLPPSVMVDSGNGIHAYWKFNEALGPDEKDRVEAALKLLCDLVGGDTLVTHPGALMRLPGSHNTKHEGQNHEVVAWKNDGGGSLRTYEVDDLEEWLAETSPIILRKVRPAANTAIQNDVNFYTNYAERHGSFKAPIDVKQRLEQMMYAGGGDSSVHKTQLDVSASLLSSGVDIEEVVQILMAATKAAAGDYGKRWDWSNKKNVGEEWRIRNLSKTWVEKPEVKEHIERKKHKQSKPLIRIHAGDHASIADKVERSLIELEVQFFQRSGELVRPVSVTVPAADEAQTKVVHLREVNAIYMRDTMSRCIEFERFDMRKNQWVPATAPLDVAVTIIERKAEWKFRHVIGVISTPTMRPDGSILSVEGHDRATNLLLVNPPKLPAIPDSPTREDALASLERLKELFSEFPYTDPASLSVALSGVISAIARGAFLNAPMHGVSAPEAGSGKSYQGDVTAMVAIGDKMPVMSTGANEEETEKRLGSAMIAGQSLISIDNIPSSRTLTGDTLCQLIERPVVDVRVLGKSKRIAVDTRGSMVFCTGNQLTLGGDICRRVILSSLDPQLERPELRQFKGDPVKKVKADRGRYIADCLIVVRAYFVAGRPDQAPKLASFEAWSDTVRSALIWLGEADPVDTMEVARADDPERQGLSVMIEAWIERFGIGKDHKQTVADIVEAASLMVLDGSTGFNNEPENPQLHTACVTACDRRGRIDVDSLGLWLRGKKGRISDGRKIMNDTQTKKGKRTATLWWIELVTVTTEGDLKKESAKPKTKF